MQRIDTVIFDLGRVLVRLIADGAKFGELMRAVGVAPEQAFDKYWFAHEVRQHMTGEMDPRTFHRTVTTRFKIDFDFDSFSEAWCDIFAPAPEMTDLFCTLASRYNVGILSDTDPLHWRKARELCPWLERVERPTLSYEVGYLKPHPSMFDAAARNTGRSKDKCLFIDDLIANVDGARYWGMPALHFVDPRKLRRDLTGLGLLATKSTTVVIKRI